MKNRIVVAVLVVASSACMKSFDRYKARSTEIEAKMVMRSIANGLITGSLDRDGMCPATTPVPADVDVLKDAPYRSKPSDWDDSWKCVLDTEKLPDNPIDTPQQHFQYSVTPSSDGTSTVITAKGYPGGPSELHTITQTCTLVDKVLKCGEFQGLIE